MKKKKKEIKVQPNGQIAIVQPKNAIAFGPNLEIVYFVSCQTLRQVTQSVLVLDTALL